jgi:hypothetical protein
MSTYKITSLGNDIRVTYDNGRYTQAPKRLIQTYFNPFGNADAANDRFGIRALNEQGAGYSDFGFYDASLADVTDGGGNTFASLDALSAYLDSIGVGSDTATNAGITQDAADERYAPKETSTVTPNAITLADSGNYTFTGPGGTVWMLPTIASSAYTRYFLKNAGTGLLTVQTADMIFALAPPEVKAVSMNVGEAIILYNNSEFWEVQ